MKVLLVVTALFGGLFLGACVRHRPTLPAGIAALGVREG